MTTASWRAASWRTSAIARRRASRAWTSGCATSCWSSGSSTRASSRFWCSSRRPSCTLLSYSSCTFLSYSSCTFLRFRRSRLSILNNFSGCSSSRHSGLWCSSSRCSSSRHSGWFSWTTSSSFHSRPYSWSLINDTWCWCRRYTATSTTCCSRAFLEEP